jgi:hypothetical protein
MAVQPLSSLSKIAIYNSDVNLDDRTPRGLHQGATIGAVGLAFTGGLPVGTGDYENNIAIGVDALAAYTGTGNNVAIGYEALKTVTGGENLGVGAASLKLSAGTSYSIGLGTAAGYNSSGAQNIWVGGYAGPYYYAHTGGYNTMIGVQSGILMSGASAQNTGIGSGSLYYLSTGNQNTAIGQAAGSGITTGSNNVMIGYGNNGVTTGSNNVVIGRKTGLAGGLSDTIILASNGTTRLHINSDGDAGFGTETPTSKVAVEGVAMRQLRMVTPGGPASNADTAGQIGDLAYDVDHLYIKTSNGWGRVALDFAF